jgi:diguanylate cyclase (GGDEF)-like protein
MTETTTLPDHAVDQAQENLVKILAHLAGSGENARLEPVVSSEARVGYYYPGVCTLLDCKPGHELRLLEVLAEMDCLARHPFDKVDLCPYCLDARLRLRRLCSYCRSSLIVRKEVLHHFTCGWVGIEDEAKQGADLICPKCEKTLRHLGIDYERTSESYYCTSCKKVFARPVEQLLSITCGRQIPIDGAMILPIYAYSITRLGAQAAAKGSVEDLNIRKGITEKDTNLYTREYIERKMGELVNRYLRYRAGFAAVLIHLDGYQDWVAGRGHVTAGTIRKTLSSVLRGETRGVDLPGLWDEDVFVLLLPQTGRRGASVLSRRYAARVRDLQDTHIDKAPALSISIAGCPEDGDDAETLIGCLEDRLAEARKGAGGAIVGSKLGAEPA